MALRWLACAADARGSHRYELRRDRATTIKLPKRWRAVVGPIGVGARTNDAESVEGVEVTLMRGREVVGLFVVTARLELKVDEAGFALVVGRVDDPDGGSRVKAAA